MEEDKSNFTSIYKSKFKFIENSRQQLYIIIYVIRLIDLSNTF